MTNFRQLAAAAALATSCAFPALADGVVTTRSADGFEATAARLVAGIAARGFTLVADIDHSGAARASGLTLRPTRLFIFGNPRGGTPIMACAQSAGLDLPLKVLVAEAADGAVTLAHNDPVWLAGRHGVGECARGPLEAMAGAMRGLVAEAARK